MKTFYHALYIYILLFVVGIMGFYSVAFAQECNLTIKCVCESNSFRPVPCPANYADSVIDCTKEGIPQGTCAVDCGQQELPDLPASCGQIGIECRNNEVASCLVTLPVEVSQSEPPNPTCGDGTLDTGEECDGTQLGSLACEDFGCTGGTLACTASCTRDFSGCTGCPVTCNSDADCSLGQYCDLDEDASGSRECVTKKSNGVICQLQNECQSDYCVDGYCCDTACGDSCDSCNVIGNVGTCTLNMDGTPGSPIPCYPYLCDGSSSTCPMSCTSITDCASEYNCVSNQCVHL